MWMYSTLLVSTCGVLLLQNVVVGLGGTRMLEPPSRGSLWRYGYNTPTNLLDDKTDCGGYDVHYNLNNGTCGVCGDPANEATPRNHEAGGKFSPSPVPVRTYKKGGYLTVVMETTGVMFGKFEFRICSLSDSMATPEQACFDRNLLTILESEQGTSYMLGSRQGVHTLNIQLPGWLTCSHCLLQWRHVTGFKINQDKCYTCPGGGEQKCHVCLGCGKQVWYTGCTDIAIYDFALGALPPSTAGTSTATTARFASGDLCPPCISSVDSTNNIINVSKPYTSPSYANTAPLPAPSSTTPPPPPPPKPTPGVNFMTPSTSPDMESLSTPNSFKNFQQPLSVTRSSLTNENRQTIPTTSAATTTTLKPTPSPKPKLLLKRTFSAQTSTTAKPSPSPSTTKSKPSKPPIVCYVTNRKRHPKLSIDHWCGNRCPGLGNSICLFKLCMPLPCKMVKNQPASSAATGSASVKHVPATSSTTSRKPLPPSATGSASVKHIPATSSTTSRKPQPPTYINSVREIPPRDLGRQYYPNWGVSKQPEMSNRQSNWNWMSLMSYFMLSSEL